MSAIMDFAATGGPVIWVLMVMSFVSLALIAVKALDLWGVTAGGAERDAALSALRAGNGSGAVGGGAPASRVLQAGLDTTSGLTNKQLEAELERHGNAEVARMSRFLRVLEVIAMVGPLLGLLGTVLGMIEAFQQLELEGGSANAAVLAGGIWKALLTTAAGLIVAIPAAVAAHLYGARVELVTVQIEDTITRLLAARGVPTSAAQS